MFLLKVENFNELSLTSLKKHSVFPINHISCGPFTLYYQDRPDYLIDFKPDYLSLERRSFHAPDSKLQGDGQFSSIKCEIPSCEVTVISDPMNTKPVFYKKDFSAWSSHCLLINPTEINQLVLQYFLYLSYNPFFSTTIFTDIDQTLPGSIHKFTPQGLNIEHTDANLFNIAFAPWDIDERIFYGDLTRLHAISIQKALSSVKGGIHLQLSGGIDSRGLLSEIHRFSDGTIHSHGYGPEWFSDNRVALEIERHLPRLTHHLYEFDNGNDIEKDVEKTIFFSSVNGRFDDTFRSYSISYNMGEYGAPLFGSMAVDSLFGDETRNWMSETKPFSEANPNVLCSIISYFLNPYNLHVFPKDYIQQLNQALHEHYLAILPPQISERRGYDILNMLVRHGKATIGMFYGTEPCRAFIVPFLHYKAFEFAFRSAPAVRNDAHGYINYLSNFCYLPELTGIPTTRQMAELSRRFNAWEQQGQQLNQAQNNLKQVLTAMQKDYYYVFYENNKNYHDFIADNVCGFDNRKLVPGKFQDLLSDSKSVRVLTTVALLNRTLDTL